jgi:hypothetical protein
MASAADFKFDTSEAFGQFRAYLKVYRSNKGDSCCFNQSQIRSLELCLKEEVDREAKLTGRKLKLIVLLELCSKSA